ncbi:MAG TPA: hypothetical protein VLE72_00340 [Candidatus Saccharimonadales bacterium]|nr:hypothetical protein [Candidatus Saccharimonadales bacterium]
MEQEPKSPEQGEFSTPELEAKPESTSPEHYTESEADRGRKVEAARQSLERETKSVDTLKPKEAEPAKKEPTGLDRKAAYADTMATLQRHLPTFSRGFSKVIHNPVIDKTSEVVGSTVLRPSITLGATSTALLVGGFTYFLAKHYGYSLSGSAMLLSLVIGGLIGLLIEGLSKLFRRKA